MEVLKSLSEENLQSNIESSMFIMELGSEKCFWSKGFLLAMEPPKKNESPEHFFASVLHEDDIGRFMRDYRKIADGTFCSCANSYRMRDMGGCYQNMSVKLWTAGEECTETRKYLAGIIAEADNYGNLDPVTLLPNNYSFRKYLYEEVKKKENWAVIMLGIDDFTNINELFSYSTGNVLLQDCARRIQQLLPDNAGLFRLDGDGFGVVLYGCDEECVKAWYEELKKSCITEKFNAKGYKFFLTISGGSCCFPKDGNDFETIYRNASKALQTSKKNGKNCLVVYSEELAEKDRRKATLLSALRESVVLGFKGFYMVYQPIVSAENQTLVGSEALLRWDSPYFPEEEISPVEFIPVLEENGLMLETGRWVLETAIRQCAEWCRYKPDFQMNINVSSLQFEVPSFKYLLMEMLTEYEVKPANITLELTESGKVKDPLVLGRQFDFIRGQGIHIALDDFGTGYSSLEILRLLSADELKIDRSFLERISYDVTDQALLSTLVSLSRNMNMEVCVEGIENSKMEKHVCSLNPDLLQGFLYSHPLRAKDFEAKYFDGIPADRQTRTSSRPEHSQSLVYASFRPAQSMSSQEMIDSAYAGIFQVGMDEEFSLLTCNEGYRRMLGYTAQEVEKKFKNHALGLVHPDDIKYVNEEIRRQLGESDTVTIEFRVVRKDGTPIWIVGTGNVYHGNDGSASLVVVIINNDKNKRRQLSMEREHAMSKNILNNLPTGVKCVRFDADFTIDYISDSMLGLTGYTREDIRELFDNKYINLIYEEDRAAVTNDILEQLKVSNVVTMRYRTPCKDGRYIWLETISKLCEAGEDGIQRAYSMVMDITDNGEEKKDTDRGLKIANRYEMVAEQLGEYFMEYDFDSDKAVFSDNFNRVFGYQGKISLAELMTRVHEEDTPELQKRIDEAKGGTRPDSVELRLFIPGKTYRWFSVTMTIPEKFGDKPMTVLAKLTDIDEEKKEIEQLRLKSQHDSTTALLNKAATEERIRALLDGAGSDDHYVFFMIDIDHFKRVNDMYGHFTGDEVLRSLAQRIRGRFRGEDIIGRIGGDEFLVFMSYSGDIQEVISKARLLVDVLHQPIQVDGETVKATVSVGASCYPEDGKDFYNLYRRADSALYRRKSMNRDGFCLAARFEPPAE